MIYLVEEFWYNNMAEYLHYIFCCRQFSFVKSENSFTSVSGRGSSLGSTVLSIGLIFVFMSFPTPPQPSRNFCYFLLSQKQRNCDMFPSFSSWLFICYKVTIPLVMSQMDSYWELKGEGNGKELLARRETRLPPLSSPNAVFLWEM